MEFGVVRALSILLLLLCACGGARGSVRSAIEAGNVELALEKYEAHRASDGPDGELLAEVAALVLRKEARGDDDARSQAAFVQLTLAGTEGEDIIAELGRAETPIVRARALNILARRGDAGAKEALRELFTSEDPAVLALSLDGLDATREGQRLRDYLRHPDERVRAAAASLLIRGAPDAESRLALAQASRVDPSARVRGAAVRSLGNYGTEAVEPLRERLSDADAGVRMSAVGAIADADRDRATPILGGLLAMGPSSASVEAARVLAQVPFDEAAPMPDGVVTARAFLRRALVSAEPRVRTQAGIALMGLGRGREMDASLEEALAAEADTNVRVAIAIALRARDPESPIARSALEALLEVQGMARVQAAAELASNHLEHALEVLRAAMNGNIAVEKRVAVRALSRGAMRPDEVREALRDADPMVRIAAAGGVLAAAAAS